MIPNAKDILKTYWGYSDFRPGQHDIVQSILNGTDTLALLPTGGGKSICFQVPGLILPGLTLVVSPLIALMKDQVDGLIKRGIHAAFLNSGQTWKEQQIIMENALQGHYKFLYVAPERLISDSFRAYLPNLEINALVVDEAHCISMWGSDFRPSFRRIYEIREQLPPKIPVAAFTASAPQWIQDDIVKGLELKGVAVFQGDFKRSNLVFQVVESSNKWMLLLKALKNTQGCSIVFGSTRKTVKDTAEWLQSEGISAHYYHGGLSHSERTKKQQEWMQGQTRVMVCTNAFGMGVDKPDVRYVFHVSPSMTPEDYYQEAGRAGRDGNISYCVLLHDENDWIRGYEHIEIQHPKEVQIKKVYHAMMNTIGVSPGHGLLQTYPLNYTESAAKYRIPLPEYFHSLRALEKLGYVTLNEGIRVPSKFMFTADYTEVYDFKIRYAAFENLIDVLLRSFTGVFDNYNVLYESVLAKRLKIDGSKLALMLGKLQKARIIDYVPQTTDPLITLLEPRSMYPSIDMRHLDHLKMRRLDAFNKMKEYALTETCRSSFWIGYFSQQKSVRCGSCDTCKLQHTYKDPREIHAAIRMLFEHQPRFFHELVHHFPLGFRDLFLLGLEQMIDSGEIIKNPDNTLFLSA